ncbi:catalase/peroxidase HPI [Mycolicibacterium sp. S2-37]|uniref:catalase/peroxidase HPI n=1 Tax=Mycolicibacterium sp. S2-37 TaxID=2810297 RepID=UPI001A942F0F|nr:catalase/peroxidase HPI [Mycolicibacterium sp. S2-37]MBO0676114.1 catalase/peroxidase HPI [Mycolicibacterium sp. S2-37]
MSSDTSDARPPHSDAKTASSGSESENPVIDSPHPKSSAPKKNQDWWPEQVDVSVLHKQNEKGNPLGEGFKYADAFAQLDVEAFKADVIEVIQTSQDWWPADYGNYAGLFIRMSWHAAGTYRIFDGRGGAGQGSQRFAPLNSWPDNANLDKARRLLWPIKKKYGNKISWADLIAFAGNAALEQSGFETAGFAFGREDIHEPEEMLWGQEDTWLGTDQRYGGTNDSDRQLAEPFGATTMGLIYVNPEGPEGKPDPLAAAHDIRETFGRMAMNDEETAALIVGGHTLGKTHGAADVNVGPEPEGAPMEQQGLGWKCPFGAGNGNDTVTSGLEVIWTGTNSEWSNAFLENLYGNEWELTKSPAGAWQFEAKNAEATIPDPFGGPPRKPTMLVTDVALREDPIYGEITRRWLDHPEEMDEAFRKAWYKLMHRDMGPISRYLGPWVAEPQLWQDPVPPVEGELIGEAEIAELKGKLLDSGLSIQQLIKTAWSSASSFRGTDKRGGANGARVRLEPQKNWESNEPAELAKVLPVLEQIQQEFNGSGKNVSLADLIVLGGTAAVEKAAKDAGHDITVPFTPGRTDASQEQTDVESFAVLEPRVDGFRNFFRPDEKNPLEQQLVEKAYMLDLTGPELTVLIGGLRVLDVNHGGSKHGVFTDTPGVLTNDFFTNLLDMRTEWKPSENTANVFDGRDRVSGESKWTATANDLVFGSNSVLRGIAEVYAQDDSKEKFVKDFAKAWAKVMDNDRFEVKK